MEIKQNFIAAQPPTMVQPSVCLSPLNTTSLFLVVLKSRLRSLFQKTA